MKCIQPIFSQLYTGSTLQWLKEKKSTLTASLSKDVEQIAYYFTVDDPYAYLSLQLLPSFFSHYGIKWMSYILPHKDIKQDLELLQQSHFLHDTEFLADYYGLESLPENKILSESTKVQLEKILLSIAGQDDFATEALGMLKTAWEKPEIDVNSEIQQTQQHQAELISNDNRLKKQGHYASSMLYFRGEWYSVPDRLQHLAKKLSKLKNQPVWSFPRRAVNRVKVPKLLPPANQSMQFFFSFRSPYSYLALQRIFTLTEKYGIKLDMKPILPMVMRGVPVSRNKRFYILRDAKREAIRLNIPFGKICDPLGVGIENCMRGFFSAIKINKEKSYVLSIMQGIWSEGKNVAKMDVLRSLVERSGIDWHEIYANWHDNQWQLIIEENRQDLTALGLWGVPSFHYQNLQFWGQDRLPFLASMIEVSSGV